MNLNEKKKNLSFYFSNPCAFLQELGMQHYNEPIQ
jgi:hypothetical protein